VKNRGLRGRAAAIAIAFAIASQAFAEAQTGLRPAGLRPDSSSPEAGLWTISDKAENQARQQAELNRDQALNEYVRSVACKVAAAYCGELRVYIMDRPFFNASMAPNGYMEVWSGMLLRAGNEAELAFVLGHESGHFAHSHSWQALQDMKARANGAMVASLLISAVGVAAMANAGTAAAVDSISTATQGLVNVVYLGSMAGMFGFSRNTTNTRPTRMAIRL
jgi:predicted Zn-dependent protease